MAHYIDADRLRKELNKWRDIQPTTVGLPRKATYEAMGVIQTIDHVLWLITALQQEQLASEGLEEEFDEECHRYFNSMTPEQFLNTPNTVIARHFYELGKNARKEDK